MKNYGRWYLKPNEFSKIINNIKYVKEKTDDNLFEPATNSSIIDDLNVTYSKRKNSSFC